MLHKEAKIIYIERLYSGKGIALLSYSLAAVVQSNGYLAAYLCGIILGNSNINNKKALMNFFTPVETGASPVALKIRIYAQKVKCGRSRTGNLQKEPFKL